MFTNKVLNREEDKDYALENKFLNVEDSYDKKWLSTLILFF